MPPRTFAWGSAILFVVVWTVGPAVMMLPLVLVVPMFAAVFRDFGTTLPVVTSALIASSQWLRGNYFLVIAGTMSMAAVASILIGLARELGQRRLAKSVAVSIALLFGLFIVEMLFFAVGLFAPMNSMIQSVHK